MKIAFLEQLGVCVIMGMNLNLGLMKFKEVGQRIDFEALSTHIILPIDVSHPIYYGRKDICKLA